jgi:hypothetical protein
VLLSNALQRGVADEGFELLANQGRSSIDAVRSPVKRGEYTHSGVESPATRFKPDRRELRTKRSNGAGGGTRVRLERCVAERTSVRAAAPFQTQYAAP